MAFASRPRGDACGESGGSVRTEGVGCAPTERVPVVLVSRPPLPVPAIPEGRCATIPFISACAPLYVDSAVE